MAFRMTIAFNGDDVAQLDRVLVALGDFPRDVFNHRVKGSAGEKIAEEFREIVEKQIESGGRRGGKRFKPLTPRYAARKARVAEGAPILVLHGKMRKALTQPGGDHLTAYRGSNSGGLLTMGIKPGTDAFMRAAVHQSGTKDGRVPARPPIVLTDADRNRWVRYVQEYVRKVMKKAR